MTGTHTRRRIDPALAGALGGLAAIAVALAIAFSRLDRPIAANPGPDLAPVAVEEGPSSRNADDAGRAGVVALRPGAASKDGAEEGAVAPSPQPPPPPPPPADAAAEVLASAGPEAAREAAPVAPPSPARPAVEVREPERPALVMGRVLTPEGEPLEGATVVAIPRWGSDRPTATAGPDGEYRLEALPAPGRYRLEARVTERIRGRRSIRVEPGDVVGGVDFVLAVGGAISGRVLDAEGGGIPDAVVTARPSRLPAERARTDAEGRYRIGGLPRGNVELAADGEAYLPSKPRVVKLGGKDEAWPVEVEGVDLTLKRGAEVSGRTIAGDGAPIHGVFVSAFRDGKPPAKAEEWSDRDGRYTLRGLEPGLYRVLGRAAKPGLTARVEIALAAREVRTDVDLVLSGGGAIEGRIVDEAGGPVASVRVQATSLPSREVQRAAASGADGRYRIPDLYDGTYSVEVDPREQGYEPPVDPAAGVGPALVTVFEGEATADVDFELKRGATLFGLVIAPDGAALAGARVSAFRLGASIGTIASDPDGQYRLLGLPSGEVEVFARAPEGVDRVTVVLAPGIEAPPLDLYLRPAATVRGIVVDVAGKPVRGVEVEAISRPYPVARRKVKTDKKGAFKLDDLYAGRWAIRARQKKRRAEVEIGVPPSSATDGLVLTLP